MFEALLQLVGAILDDSTAWYEKLSVPTLLYLRKLGIPTLQHSNLPVAEVYRRIFQRVSLWDLLDELPDMDDWVCFVSHTYDVDDLAELGLSISEPDDFLCFVWQTELCLLAESAHQQNATCYQESVPRCLFTLALQQAIEQKSLRSESDLHALLRQQHLVRYDSNGRGDQLVSCLAFLTRCAPKELAEKIRSYAGKWQVTWERRLQMERSGRSWSDWCSQEKQWQHGDYVDIVADAMGRALLVVSSTKPSVMRVFLPRSQPVALVEPLLLIRTPNNHFHCICPCPFQPKTIK
jgi:hypothetical protein